MKRAVFTTLLLVLSSISSSNGQVPPPDVDPLLPAVYENAGDIGVNPLLGRSRSEEPARNYAVGDTGLGIGSLGSASTKSTVDLQPEMFDPVFASYVDIAQVIEAIKAGDAARLADHVAQLMEGERILFRPHKALTARRALEVCLSITNSQEVIDRLKSLTDRYKREDLAKVIEEGIVTQKLMAESRGSVIAFTIDELSPERLRVLKELASEIEAAVRLQDAAGLTELESMIKELPVLTVKEQEYLSQHLATAKAILTNDGEGDVLLKLASTSRHPGNQNDPVRRLILEFILRLLLELALNNQGTLSQSQTIGVGGGIPQPIIPPAVPGLPFPGPGGGGGGISGGLSLTGGLYKYNAQPATSIDGQWNSAFGSVWLTQTNGHVVTGTVEYFQGGQLELSGQYSSGALVLRFQHRSDPRVQGAASFVMSPDQARLDGTFQNTVSGRTGNWVLQR